MSPFVQGLLVGWLSAMVGTLVGLALAKRTRGRIRGKLLGEQSDPFGCPHCGGRHFTLRAFELCESRGPKGTG